MNQILTIPRKLVQKGELIVMPRRDYEAVLHSLKEQRRLLQKKFLDAKLQKAIDEYNAGK